MSLFENQIFPTGYNLKRGFFHTRTSLTAFLCSIIARTSQSFLHVFPHSSLLSLNLHIAIIIFLLLPQTANLFHQIFCGDCGKSSHLHTQTRLCSPRESWAPLWISTIHHHSHKFLMARLSHVCLLIPSPSFSQITTTKHIVSLWFPSLTTFTTSIHATSLLLILLFSNTALASYFFVILSLPKARILCTDSHAGLEKIIPLACTPAACLNDTLTHHLHACSSALLQQNSWTYCTPTPRTVLVHHSSHP